MGVFFIGSVLKIIIIILVLQKNRSQQNYSSRSPMDYCSTIPCPTRHFVLLQSYGGEEEDWKLMAGTIVTIKFVPPQDSSRTPYTDPYTGIILSIVGKKRNNRVLYRNNSDKNWLTAGALCKSVVSQFTQHLTTGFVSFVCPLHQ